MRTRGRWTNNGGQIEGPGGYPNVIATVGTVNEQTLTDTANANLIATVPQMVDALGKLRLAAWTMTEPEKWGGDPEKHIPWQKLADEATEVLREAGVIK